MNNKYTKFFFKLFTLIIVLVIIDQIIGRTMEHFYFKQESGAYYRTTYVMDSTTADIVVFGSSRANHHYVPQIFEDSLGLSFYNAGRDGNFLLFNYATFKSLLTRYTPKIVIFDLYDEDFVLNERNKERLSSLLPYYRTHPEVREIADSRSTFEKIKLLSAIYPYNSSLWTLLVRNMKMNKTRKADDRGYVPVIGEMAADTFSSNNHTHLQIDTTAVTKLQEIQQSCKTKNIDLYFVYSPIYRYEKSVIIDSLLQASIDKTQAVFIDYSESLDFSENNEVFKDRCHLNSLGAVLFSKKIACVISMERDIKKNDF